jgi:hypothetical protein
LVPILLLDSINPSYDTSTTESSDNEVPEQTTYSSVRPIDESNYAVPSTSNSQQEKSLSLQQNGTTSSINIPVRISSRSTFPSRSRPYFYIPISTHKSSEANLVYPNKSINTQTSINSKAQFFVPSIALSNVVSLAPKIYELRQFANDHEPAIMCFTETWLKETVDNNVIFINHYSIVRKDRTRAQHGGVCMYVRASTPVTILTEYDVEDVEILWCKLRPSRLPRGFSHLIVATVYHPPTADDNVLINHITDDTLSKIESTMPHAAIIIAGDFNRLN